MAGRVTFCRYQGRPKGKHFVTEGQMAPGSTNNKDALHLTSSEHHFLLSSQEATLQTLCVSSVASSSGSFSLKGFV